MEAKSTAPVDFVFWPASARTHGFRGHVEAAGAGRFTSLAIAPDSYLDALESGLTPSDMKAMAADVGAPLRYFDSLTDWTPIRFPQNSSAGIRARFDVSTDFAFRMCEKLGLTTILAVAGYDRGTVRQNQLADGFGALCERAKAQGYWVDLEFMPFWGLPNLADAWRIVQDVNPSNAGILVDTWHFSKGDADMALLRAIPARYFTGVQIADGFNWQVGQSMFDDTINHRTFAGEGEFRITEILKVIAAKGALRHIGPEVFSLEADTLSAYEAGERSASTSRVALDAANISFSYN